MDGNDSSSTTEFIPSTLEPFIPPDPTHNPVWATIAGLFAWLALGISVWSISLHLINYNKPYLQKYVIRILCMVPIYAMNSVSRSGHKLYGHL